MGYKGVNKGAIERGDLKGKTGQQGICEAQTLNCKMGVI
jgi:hypothetical protein